jgi:hypothetical protein
MTSAMLSPSARSGSFVNGPSGAAIDEKESRSAYTARISSTPETMNTPWWGSRSTGPSSCNAA